MQWTTGYLTHEYDYKKRENIFVFLLENISRTYCVHCTIPVEAVTGGG